MIGLLGPSDMLNKRMVFFEGGGPRDGDAEWIDKEMSVLFVAVPRGGVFTLGAYDPDVTEGDTPDGGTWMHRYRLCTSPAGLKNVMQYEGIVQG